MSEVLWWHMVSEQTNKNVGVQPTSPTVRLGKRVATSRVSPHARAAERFEGMTESQASFVGLTSPPPKAFSPPKAQWSLQSPAAKFTARSVAADSFVPHKPVNAPRLTRGRRRFESRGARQPFEGSTEARDAFKVGSQACYSYVRWSPTRYVLRSSGLHQQPSVTHQAAARCRYYSSRHKQHKPA